MLRRFLNDYQFRFTNPRLRISQSPLIRYLCMISFCYQKKKRKKKIYFDRIVMKSAERETSSDLFYSNVLRFFHLFHLKQMNTLHPFPKCNLLIYQILLEPKPKFTHNNVFHTIIVDYIPESQTTHNSFSNFDSTPSAVHLIQRHWNRFLFHCDGKRHRT